MIGLVGAHLPKNFGYLKYFVKKKKRGVCICLAYLTRRDLSPLTYSFLFKSHARGKDNKLQIVNTLSMNKNVTCNFRILA
jgi:hypothetical protein